MLDLWWCNSFFYIDLKYAVDRELSADMTPTYISFQNCNIKFPLKTLCHIRIYDFSQNCYGIQAFIWIANICKIKHAYFLSTTKNDKTTWYYKEWLLIHYLSIYHSKTELKIFKKKKMCVCLIFLKLSWQWRKWTTSNNDLWHTWCFYISHIMVRVVWCPLPRIKCLGQTCNIRI